MSHMTIPYAFIIAAVASTLGCSSTRSGADSDDNGPGVIESAVDSFTDQNSISEDIQRDNQIQDANEKARTDWLSIHPDGQLLETTP